jgi:hypothetical protein
MRREQTWKKIVQDYLLGGCEKVETRCQHRTLGNLAQMEYAQAVQDHNSIGGVIVEGRSKDYFSRFSYIRLFIFSFLQVVHMTTETVQKYLKKGI